MSSGLDAEPLFPLTGSETRKAKKLSSLITTIRGQQVYAPGRAAGADSRPPSIETSTPPSPERPADQVVLSSETAEQETGSRATQIAQGWTDQDSGPPSFTIGSLNNSPVYSPPATVSELLESKEQGREIARGYREQGFPGAEGAEVAVIDRFSYGHGDPLHGDDVASVVQREGQLSDEQILRIPSAARPEPGILTLPDDRTASERVDLFMEQFQVDALEITSDRLEELLEHGPETLTTVNQSQGISELGGVKILVTNSFEMGPDGEPARDENGNKVLSPQGQVIFEGLGLPLETSRENVGLFLERALDRSHQLHQTSPRIAEARERHESLSADLMEQGIQYVVGAGNDGGEARFLADEVGLEVPESADDNLLTNPFNVSVGAFDTKGTSAPSDDTLADFSSTGPEVDILANGVDVAVGDPDQGRTEDGTSFAAPAVSAELNRLAQLHPELDSEALRRLLASSNAMGILGNDLPVLR